MRHRSLLDRLDLRRAGTSNKNSIPLVEAHKGMVQGSLNGTNFFGGDSNLMQMYGNLEEF